MVMIYYRKIKDGDGSYTIEDVPERWRDAVQKKIDASND